MDIELKNIQNNHCCEPKVHCDSKNMELGGIIVPLVTDHVLDCLCSKNAHVV